MSLRREAKRSGDYTAQPFFVPAVRTGAMVTEPEFIRYPKPKDRCPLTGLSRTTLAELVDRGAVKAAKLRKKGSQRSITLIHRESLLEYLRSKMPLESRPIPRTHAGMAEEGGERPGITKDARKASKGRALKKAAA